MQIFKNTAQLARRLNFTPLHSFKTLVYQDANPKQNVVRSFEGIKDYAEFTKKPPYTFKLKKKADKFLKKIEFEFYKKRLRQQAERLMKGEKEEEVVKEEVDGLWGTEIPPVRKYEKITQKELYWIPRGDKYFAESDRKIGYLPQFVGPYQVPDGEINSIISEIKALAGSARLNADPDFDLEGFYLANEQIKSKLLQLEEKVQQLHPSILPNACLAIAFDLRYKNDKLQIWDHLEKRVFKFLFQYSLLDIAKLRHAFTGNFPKTASPVTQKAMLDLVTKELGTSSPEEILYIYHAFRNYHKIKWHQTILSQVMTRSQEFKNVKDPNFLGNLLYTYANSRIPKRDRGYIREPEEEDKEAARFLEVYQASILQNLKSMDVDTVVRVSLAYSILNLSGYEDAAINIEKFILKNLDKLDAFQIVSFLYSFSRFHKSAPAGEKRLYVAQGPLVKKHWATFSDKDKIRVFYAYAARGLAVNELQKNFFQKWVQESIDRLQYNELHNVAYALMFTNNQDENLWRRFFKNIAKQPRVIPLVYYYPLRIAKYYAGGLFKNWNFNTFDEAAQQADFAFHLQRKTKLVENNEFKRASQLITSMETDWKVFIEWENLFHMDYAILPQQLGVLLQKSSDTFVDDKIEKVSPLLLLKKKIFEMYGWRVILLNYREFIEKGEERMDWFNKLVQKEFKEQNKFYESVLEPQKWDDFFYKVYDISERAITEYDEYQELVEERMEEEKKKQAEQQAEENN